MASSPIGNVPDHWGFPAGKAGSLFNVRTALPSARSDANGQVASPDPDFAQYGRFATHIDAGDPDFFNYFFLTDVTRIPLATAGCIIDIARLWDAVNDPLVGLRSDRIRSKLAGAESEWSMVLSLLGWHLPLAG
jgi:hypothetical protein